MITQNAHFLGGSLPADLRAAQERAKEKKNSAADKTAAKRAMAVLTQSTRLLEARKAFESSGTPRKLDLYALIDATRKVRGWSDIKVNSQSSVSDTKAAWAAIKAKLGDSERQPTPALWEELRVPTLAEAEATAQVRAALADGAGAGAEAVRTEAAGSDILADEAEAAGAEALEVWAPGSSSDVDALLRETLVECDGMEMDSGYDDGLIAFADDDDDDGDDDDDDDDGDSEEDEDELESFELDEELFIEDELGDELEGEEGHREVEAKPASSGKKRKQRS